MSAFRYTAKRSLVSGHTAGTDYDLDLEADRIDGPGGREEINERKALDGTSQTIFHRLEEIWEFRVFVASQSDLAALREFLDSVADRQAFTFDPYGTVASPDDPKTGKLVRRDETPSRQGAGTTWSIGFRIRVIS